ncbi:hypothetical protein CEY12_04025 [Chryseobacterium sp. T16E-39]|uniref:hypothetical protein n=1 Tax=Chryseobacterium sp. T16E-39 TaxID=2015076 RepID=UPI000B5B1314|nr:hypothetical protein [Chryseobacterium sp. T16E-39]ASK29319.1 hypothetical protein CEY12_04025 [Chryseobacterium sp. T16E-39]
MNEIEFFSKHEALNEARELSEKYSEVLHVIKSYEVYYIDAGGITEDWEVLIATFAFGTQIKGEGNLYSISTENVKKADNSTGSEKSA